MNHRTGWTDKLTASVLKLVHEHPNYVRSWLIANDYLGADEGLAEFKQSLAKLLGNKKFLSPRQGDALTAKQVEDQLNYVKMSVAEELTKAVEAIDLEAFQALSKRFSRLVKSTRLTDAQKETAQHIRNYIQSIVQLRWYNRTTEQMSSKKNSRTKPNSKKVKSSPSTSTKVRKQTSAKASNPSAKKRRSADEKFKLFKAVYDQLSKPVREKDRAAARSPSRIARSPSAEYPEIARQMEPGIFSSTNEQTNALKRAARPNMKVLEQLSEEFPRWL
jgi:hypothetical protein